MANITMNSKKQITINGEIRVDEQIVVTQNAVIDSEDPNNMSLNDYIANKELYKTHRVEIRKLKDQFEEEAYLEQEILLEAGNTPTGGAE